MSASAAPSSSIASEFEPLFQQLERERQLSDAIREKSKELDRSYRTLSSLLNGVHSGVPLDSILDAALAVFAEVRAKVGELSRLVPADGFYRWCDDFSFALKNLTSAIALIVLLSTGGLVSISQASAVLGLGEDSRGRVQLGTEDYLHALINTLNDLPRLAVNSVTRADYRTPVRLSAVVKQIHAGFQVLNLRNDSLRKRFDSLKYDVKKIEEIVYDISLRGLVSATPDEGEQGLAFARGPEVQQNVVDRLAGVSLQS